MGSLKPRKCGFFVFIMTFHFKSFFAFFIILLSLPDISGNASEYSPPQYLSRKSNRNTSPKLFLKTFLPPPILESSGLVYTDDKLWTHNDKGGAPAIFNIDTLTGAIKQTVIIDNYPNIDWEDITADQDHIYIGDFGNNYGIRKDLKVLIIDKSSISNDPVIHVNAKAISFSYADQFKFVKNKRNDFDCESIISLGDNLYLFTKDRNDNKTRVYRVPKALGTYKINPYTGFNVNGRICGASYNPETRELALIGYMPYTTNSFLWLMDDFEGDQFFSGSKKRIEIGKNKTNWKTEGITYQSNSRLFISCEATETEKAALYIYVSEKK